MRCKYTKEYCEQERDMDKNKNDREIRTQEMMLAACGYRDTVNEPSVFTSHPRGNQVDGSPHASTLAKSVMRTFRKVFASNENISRYSQYILLRSAQNGD